MKHRYFRFWWPLAALAFAALFSFAVMFLWNWLLPVITGLPEITFLQALGLLALSRILFGGFGDMGRMAMGGAIRSGGRGRANPFREKWETKTDEERKEFLRKHNPFYSHIFGDCQKDEPAPNKDKE
jgi:hypothetical protein